MDKAIVTLEFDKIRERLAGHTSFSASADLALALTPSDDLVVARQRVSETAEARRLLEIKPDVGVGGARDVRPAAARASRGIILLPQDLLDVRHTVAAARSLQKSILRLEQDYPLLAHLARGISDCQAVVDAVDTALDDQGTVMDSASPKLARVRRDMRIARDRIQEKLQRLISSAAAQYLQEAIISQRGGRWVIPLQSNFKGRVRGIIHDQSASGATLWVEPLATVDLNNQYRELLLQEEEEVQRILAELSALVGDHADRIQWTVEALASLDLAFAKAKYAFAIKAVEPDLVPFQTRQGRKGQPATASLHPGSTLRLIQARHPLLAPKTVVPIDVELDQDTFIVIITGPNTGGKTVSLKTVGLLALMAQAGLHLPCVEATLSVFETIFADIGDEQSIEQSLSTFSGHMVNVVEILDLANEHSLVVLDELGAGTDPSEGSALARAILNYLRDRGATTFVATHYPELKLYGHNTPGVTNASVEFDLETLAPTFRLRIGLAGRSNAFAIARRLGLDQDIIRDARTLISSSETTAEDLLESIHRARDQAEAEAANAEQARAEAAELRQAVQRRLDRIDLERLRILQDARIQAQAELEAFQAEIRDLRRRLNAAGQPLAEIRRLQQEAELAADHLEHEPERLSSVEPAGGGSASRPIQPGDTVWLSNLGVEGQVLSMNDDQAEVQIGRLRLRANRDELEWRSSPAPAPVERELPQSMAGRAVLGQIELDLRGERVEAALKRLDSFLDAALLANAPFVRIIHGKGTGQLRSAIRQALKAHGQVKDFEDGKDGEGGWGVTVAHFRAD